MKDSCYGCERREMCPSVNVIDEHQEQILRDSANLCDQLLDIGCKDGFDTVTACGVDEAFGEAADRIYCGTAIAVQQYARVVNGVEK